MIFRCLTCDLAVRAPDAVKHAAQHRASLKHKCLHKDLHTLRESKNFLSRIGCLDCNEWLEPTRRKEKQD